MKYVRTEDGRIVDIEKFINEEKDTPYYKDFEFEEISKDGELKWTAIGTEKCSIKDQIGRRCHFSATLHSEVIKQADTIEELIQHGDLCHLAECQVCRDRISVVKVFPREDYIGISVPGIEYGEDSVLELWIRDPKNNFIKVAEKDSLKEKLHLL